MFLSDLNEVTKKWLSAQDKSSSAKASSSNRSTLKSPKIVVLSVMNDDKLIHFHVLL